MSEVFMLSRKQVNRMKQYFPTPHGVKRVNARRVISGIIYVIKNGLQWKDASGLWSAQDAVQSLCTMEPRGSVQSDLPRASEGRGLCGRLDDQRHAPQGAQNSRHPAQKRAVSRCIGRTKGGLNSKLNAVCDEAGRPVRLLLSEGQMSDYKGARRLLPSLTKATYMIADRGYDADWFREALKKKGMPPCIPPRQCRKNKRCYNKTLYKQRHKIEIMFGRLKDWRRISMRYDRCAHTFFSAICIAAAFMFYLK